MLTSDSVVTPAGSDAAVGAGTEPGADSEGLHPVGRSDARPAPSERAPKSRRESTSGRGRDATMSSKESPSHMRASRRALGGPNKGDAFQFKLSSREAARRIA